MTISVTSGLMAATSVIQSVEQLVVSMRFPLTMRASDSNRLHDPTPRSAANSVWSSWRWRSAMPRNEATESPRVSTRNVSGRSSVTAGSVRMPTEYLLG
jgi:hypothetical protein